MEPDRQQQQPIALKKPRRPKKAQTKSKMVTGYIIYASEIRKEIIKKHKDKNFGEISKIVGDEWKQLSQENKVAYEKRAQEQNSLFKMEFAAEAALELSKLADVAAAQAAKEEKQQEEHQHQLNQSQHQHQHHQLQFQLNQHHQHQSLVPLNMQHHHQQALAVYQQQQAASANSNLHHQQQQLQLQQPHLHHQPTYHIEDLRSTQHHHHQQQQQQHQQHQQQHQQMNDIMANLQQQQQQGANVKAQIRSSTPLIATNIYEQMGQQVPTPSSIGTASNREQSIVSISNPNSVDNNSCPTPSAGAGACVSSEEPAMTQQQQQQLPEQEQQSQRTFASSIDLTTNSYGASNNPANVYPNYQQQGTSAYYPQMMNQSMPMLIRQGNFNGPPSAVDALLQTQQQQPLSQQQQQPFQILQHQQQPISTMVQYCNNPACCCPNSARYQPYPYPYSPPAQPATPTSVQQASSMSPQLSPTHQQYPYKRNNIIYRRPIIIKLRPKDASTQTEPIKWVEKTDKDQVSACGDKKPLRFSQKFIDHMICATTNSPTKNKDDTDNDSNNNDSSSNNIDDAETL